MDTATKPIVTTTSLSLLLHSAAIAGALLLYEHVAIVDEGVGQGVEVQLISSVRVSDQPQTEVPQADILQAPEMMADAAPEQRLQPVKETRAEELLASLSSTQSVASEHRVEMTVSDSGEMHAEAGQKRFAQHTKLYPDTSSATALQSTNASQHQHTILELLHRRISSNKEYPYLARRQRREGVATVAFVLHPDGRIEDARLVVSSHARVLDRAALAAVEQVEPFEAAKDYLKTAEIFQVDIEFDLL
jgi:TonB family protein